MTRLPLAALTALLAPAAALACPTAADLPSGVMIDFDDNTTEHYLGLRDDLVRLERRYDGVTEAVMDLAHGVYVLTYMEIYDGAPDTSTRITTAYPGGLSSLTPPQAGERWEAATVVTNSDGPYTEQVTVAWSEPTEVQIGDCTYAALEGIIAYVSDEPLFEGITFLTDLGVGYVSWFEDGQGRESYTALGIAAGS